MIKLLRQFLGRYREEILVIMVLLLAQALTTLYLPALNADIINNGVAKGDTAYIINVGAVMLVITALLGICSVTAVYFGARVAMGFGRDVRLAVFRKVSNFSQVEMNKFGTPSLITRNTNDVQQVQLIVFMGLTVILLAPIMGIGGVILAFREDGPLSALLLVILPIMFAFIFFITSRAVPLFRAMQVKVDRINQVMREALAGVRVIRAFVRVEHEEKRFDEASTDLFETGLKVNRLFALTFPVMLLIFNLSSVAVVWFGAFRVQSGDLTIGGLTAFLAYLIQILFSVLMAIFMIIFLPRAVVSAAAFARFSRRRRPSSIHNRRLRSPSSTQRPDPWATGMGRRVTATDTIRCLRRPSHGERASSSSTSSSVTQAPSSLCLMTSHSSRSQATPRQSSAARAAASRR